MKKISGIYRIINTVTKDFYIGSSKNVKHRWAEHKCHSRWSKCPNNPLYKDMQKYGLDNFKLQILEETESEQLKEKEQWFIEKMHPTYNSNRANGWDFERYKEKEKEYYQHNRERLNEYQKEYYQQNRERFNEYQKKYQQSNKYKESQKKYQQSNKYKDYHKEYQNQLCCYNNETITLCALAARFTRAGTKHPVIEAKKYLLK